MKLNLILLLSVILCLMPLLVSSGKSRCKDKGEEKGKEKEKKNKKDCELCTFQVDESIGCVNNLLKQIEPVELSKLSPCDSCKVYGIHNFKRTENHDVCTHKDGDYTHHNFHVTFENVTMVCDCMLPMSMSAMITVAASTTVAIPSQPCPPERLDQTLKSLINTGLPPLKAQDMLLLKECQNFQFSTDGVSKQVNGEPKPITGHIVAQWLGPQVSFTSTTKSGTDKVVISDVEIKTKTFKSLKAWCDGDDDYFKLCQCLVAGDFHAYLMVQALHFILPCRVDDESQKHNDIAEYFKCDE